MRRARLGSLLTVACVVVTAVLLWRFAGGFLRDAVIIPLAHQIDVIRRYVEGLPGIVVWIVILAVTAAVAVRAALRETAFPRRRAHRRRGAHVRTELQRIARSLARGRSSNAQRHLANEFTRMAAMLVAQERGLPIDAAARAIRLREVALPPPLERAIHHRGKGRRARNLRDVGRRYEDAIAILERCVEGGIFPCS
ncbi:MAG: hypothetical protein JSW65_05705 [Candidatus Bipolaricaulota bacterium]|nr:MAG: hypothetical protein JSW65_05705 [Candidatus Bipolaricaulota bacterium]